MWKVILIMSVNFKLLGSSDLYIRACKLLGDSVFFNPSTNCMVYSDYTACIMYSVCEWDGFLACVVCDLIHDIFQL